MASVNKDAKGWRVLYVHPDGSRKTLRLSGLNKAKTEAIARHIDELCKAKGSGQPIDRQTSLWLGDVGQVLHDKLSNAGLIERRKVYTVRDFVRGYIDGRADLKPRTRFLLNQSAENLNELFAERSVQSMTEADAAAFKQWLKADPGKGLGENTARRRCGHSRQFFAAAVRQSIINRNPFAGVSVAVGSSEEKHRFINNEECGRILEACPCHEWKMIFALARYGGLRCPSEVLALKWGDIDWQEKRISVPEPKVEHHAGRGRRVTPLFPELRQILEDGFELAAEGTVHVVNRYRDAGQNLRTTFLKILDRAGVQRFERPFCNLRGSRVTELRQRFDSKVVAVWMGHSETIAAKHYVQVRPEDFAAAVLDPVAHQVAHKTREMVKTGEPTETQNPVKTNVLRGSDDACAYLRHEIVLPEGLEPSTYGLRVSCSTN